MNPLSSSHGRSQSGSLASSASPFSCRPLRRLQRPRGILPTHQYPIGPDRSGFWNNTEVKVEVLREQMQKSKALSKYGGFGILPFGKSFGPEYLGEQYFAVYGSVLARARESGMTMSLYDEYGFPSGPAGAPNSSDVSLFERQFPELTIKRLDKHEETVTGPLQYHKDLPSGQIMSVVAMNTATKERVDLAEKTRERRLRWSVPAGTWKIMDFMCVKDG